MFRRRRLFSFLGGETIDNPLQLFGVYYLAVYHAGQKRFDRASAKPIDNPFDGLDGKVARRFEAGVEEGPAGNLMLDVSLVFETRKDGADRRRTQGATRLKCILDVDGADFPTR